MPVLRVDQALRAEAATRPEPTLYRPRDVGGHFSEAGHRLVARELAAFLRAQGLLGDAGE
jgi:lysophospholipase L1-like esterase